MDRKEISKNVFTGDVQKWSREGILSGTISAANAANLVNSGMYEIINGDAIDEVYF